MIGSMLYNYREKLEMEIYGKTSVNIKLIYHIGSLQDFFFLFSVHSKLYRSERYLIYYKLLFWIQTFVILLKLTSFTVLYLG